MQNLEELIRLAKENDKNAMLEIIEKFQPFINKYFKKSYYNEDMKSALELKLIEIVKLELKFDNIRVCNEGTLVNYIVSSLYHEYIAISKKNNKNSKFEFDCEEGGLIYLVDSNKFVIEKFIEDNILLESLRTILTKREFDCVYNIVFVGYTAEELAKQWDISKQACNQCKRRAFKKIIKFYYNL